MRQVYARAFGIGRAYWPAAAAAAVALGALAAGAIAVPSDREAADVLEQSSLPYRAIPYRLRDAAERPADPESVLPLVDAYVRNGQQAFALQTLDDYVRSNPEDLAALYRAARLADWENLPDEAARYRFAIIRLDPKGEDPGAESITATLRWLGDYLIWKQRHWEAGDMYLALLDLEKQDVDLALRAADVLTWAARYDDAAEALETALRLAPDRLATYVRLGSVHRWTGRTEEAINAYERATQVDSNSLLAWIELSRLYRATGQAEKLEEAVRQIRRLQ